MRLRELLQEDRFHLKFSPLTNVNMISSDQTTILALARSLLILLFLQSQFGSQVNTKTA